MDEDIPPSVFIRTFEIIKYNGSQLQFDCWCMHTIHHSKLGPSSELLALQPGGLSASGWAMWLWKPLKGDDKPYFEEDHPQNNLLDSSPLQLIF